MSSYTEWGFEDNPFTTLPLQANERGKQLLIGRDEVVKSLTNRLTSPPKIPTVEGGIGTGKTSLVNVATYVLTEKYFSGQLEDLYVACRSPFQITDRSKLEALIDSFFFEVAQTLIALNDEASRFAVAPTVRRDIERWMNSPVVSQVQIGLSIAGTGGSGGTSTALNTTTGFDRSGFRTAVIEWLRTIFPTTRGGIVCLIDNMELLEESSQARSVAEELRDTLFSIHGVRWVLCGANGIIQGVVTSPRLDGRVYSPLEVQEIPEAMIPEVLNSRIAAFSRFVGSAYLPITPAAFHILYAALNKNLRNLLSTADDFCTAIADQPTHPETDRQKDDAFFAWFDNETLRVFEAVGHQVKPRAWQVFDDIVLRGGETSPSEFEAFGFASQQAMRPQVKDLEEAGLLESTRDDQDQRRKSIIVTSKGFKAFYHRRRMGLIRQKPAKPEDATS